MVEHGCMTDVAWWEHPIVMIFIWNDSTRQKDNPLNV